MKNKYKYIRPFNSCNSLYDIGGFFNGSNGLSTMYLDPNSLASKLKNQGYTDDQIMNMLQLNDNNTINNNTSNNTNNSYANTQGNILKGLNVLQAGNEIFDTTRNLASGAKYNSTLTNQANAISNQNFNAVNASTLLNDANSMQQMNAQTYKSIGGTTNKDTWSGALSNAAAGASAGAQFGALGAAIGGGVGLLSGWLGGTLGHRKSVNQLKTLNQRINNANNNANINLNNRAEEIGNRNAFNSTTFYADGGDLFTQDLKFNNNLRYVNAGGTHEQNPNEGVAVSTDQNGTENKLEEGEVIYNNDYVFSNRLIISDELAKKLGVPKGITYAEAMKLVAKESEELPNDSIVRNGLEVNAQRIQADQEQTRAAKQQAQQLLNENQNISQQQNTSQLEQNTPNSNQDIIPPDMYNQYMAEQSEIPSEFQDSYAQGGKLYADGDRLGGDDEEQMRKLREYFEQRRIAERLQLRNDEYFSNGVPTENNRWYGRIVGGPYDTDRLDLKSSTNFSFNNPDAYFSKTGLEDAGYVYDAKTQTYRYSPHDIQYVSPEVPTISQWDGISRKKDPTMYEQLGSDLETFNKNIPVIGTGINNILFNKYTNGKNAWEHLGNNVDQAITDTHINDVPIIGDVYDAYNILDNIYQEGEVTKTALANAGLLAAGIIPGGRYAAKMGKAYKAAQVAGRKATNRAALQTLQETRREAGRKAAHQAAQETERKVLLDAERKAAQKAEQEAAQKAAQKAEQEAAQIAELKALVDYSIPTDVSYDYLVFPGKRAIKELKAGREYINITPKNLKTVKQAYLNDLKTLKKNIAAKIKKENPDIDEITLHTKTKKLYEDALETLKFDDVMYTKYPRGIPSKGTLRSQAFLRNSPWILGGLGTLGGGIYLLNSNKPQISPESVPTLGSNPEESGTEKSVHIDADSLDVIQTPHDTQDEDLTTVTNTQSEQPTSQTNAVKQPSTETNSVKQSATKEIKPVQRKIQPAKYDANAIYGPTYANGGYLFNNPLFQNPNIFTNNDNLFANGGKLTSKTKSDFMKDHEEAWTKFLLTKGYSLKKASELAYILTIQDALESYYGTSPAARNKNNYGGMQSKDENGKVINLSYKSIDHYFDAKYKMLNKRFPSWDKGGVLGYLKATIDNGPYKYATDPYYKIKILSAVKNRSKEEDKVYKQLIQEGKIKANNRDNKFTKVDKKIDQNSVNNQTNTNIKAPELDNSISDEGVLFDGNEYYYDPAFLASVSNRQQYTKDLNTGKIGYDNIHGRYTDTNSSYSKLSPEEKKKWHKAREDHYTYIYNHWNNLPQSSLEYLWHLNNGYVDQITDENGNTVYKLTGKYKFKPNDMPADVLAKDVYLALNKDGKYGPHYEFSPDFIKNTKEFPDFDINTENDFDPIEMGYSFTPMETIVPIDEQNLNNAYKPNNINVSTTDLTGRDVYLALDENGKYTGRREDVVKPAFAEDIPDYIKKYPTNYIKEFPNYDIDTDGIPLPLDIEYNFIPMESNINEPTTNKQLLVNNKQPLVNEKQSLTNKKQPIEKLPTWSNIAPLIGNVYAYTKNAFTGPDYRFANQYEDLASRMGYPISMPVDIIGDYRRKNPYDERYAINQINQNANAYARTGSNIAGGNRAAAMAYNKAGHLNQQSNIGEAMRQEYLANRADDADVANYNRQTNVYNQNAINTRNQYLAQLNSQRQLAGNEAMLKVPVLKQSVKDSYDTVQSGLYNNFMTQLGNIGTENRAWNNIAELYNKGAINMNPSSLKKALGGSIYKRRGKSNNKKKGLL